jgi:hypothetical protein
MEPTLPGPASSPEHTQAPSPDVHPALLQQCKRLEKLIIFALLAMVTTAVAVNVFLSQDARAAAFQARQMEAKFQAYNKIQPYMANFLDALQTYASQDKEFMPIWQKYRPVFTNYYSVTPDAPSNTPAGAKAPAPAPAKAKK